MDENTYSSLVNNHPLWDINISNMEERMFLVTVKGEFDESETSLKQAIYDAIENDVQDNDESPLYDCRDFSVKEVID